jgi:hypothetical protein
LRRFSLGGQIRHATLGHAQGSGSGVALSSQPLDFTSALGQRGLGRGSLGAGSGQGSRSRLAGLPQLRGSRLCCIGGCFELGDPCLPGRTLPAELRKSRLHLRCVSRELAASPLRHADPLRQVGKITRRLSLLR